MASHKLPEDKSRIDISFDVINERNNDVLLQIAQDPSSGLVHKYYDACMDTDAIEQVDMDPLNRLRSQLYFTSIRSDLLAYNHKILFQSGMSGLFDFGSTIDPYNPSTMVYAIDQAGLTLPDPSYYQDTEIYDKYVQHVTKMLDMAKFFPSADLAKSIIAFEAELAKIRVPRSELYNPFKSNNRMSWSELQALAPNVFFDRFVSNLTLKSDVAVIVDAPKYFSSLSDLLSRTSDNVLAWYFDWKVLHSMSTFMPRRFAQENFNFFGTVLSGIAVESPRLKTCIASTTSVVPQLIGQLFVKKAFPAASKTTAKSMYDKILAAFQANVRSLSWMDAQTGQRAIQKLGQLEPLIGYPDHPREYEYNFGSGFAGNWIEAQNGDFARMMAEAGQASQRDAWHSSPSIVNAFFSPATATVVMPAGILQSPFFNASFPNAMNYGGIGMVLGHELTHSLDSKGRNFDGTGKLIDWWTPESTERFQERIDCIINQYNNFYPIPPKYHINGQLTQGENVADAGGLKLAHAAYVSNYPNEAQSSSIVPELSGEQLLFVSFAQTWCSKLTPAAVIQRLLTDPHSPPQYRVNGAAINLPAFANAFKCPASSPMNPPSHCEIW